MFFGQVIYKTSLSFVSNFTMKNLIQNLLRFDGSDIKAESSSNYPHSRTTALGMYKGQPFVTGSHHNTSNKKTEILDYASKIWNVGADYPFNSGDRFVLN